MLFQPTNISPDEINNTGTVDVTQGLDVSWKVSGNSPMTAYKIDIYQNDAASTLSYSTGTVTLDTPFWGVNYAGITQYYTASIEAATLSGAGITNGNEYKFLITHYWGTNNSVQQYTASLFLARALPTLTITAIDNPVSTKAYSFTATYSQAQGDGIRWIRWRLAYADETNSPFYDSGNIYGTGELQLDYDGFLTGETYAVQCTVETANGVVVSDGWLEFDVSYEVETTQSTVSACQLADDSCVWITWESVATADGYSVMRRAEGETRLVKIADVNQTTGQVRDYSAQSGQTYTYYVFPSGNLSFLTAPMISDPVSVNYWVWTIIEAEPTTVENQYSAIRSYLFRMGSGGVSEGSISNNNSPSLSQNFTRYPTRQGTSANYKTGSLSGYIGMISAAKEYSDTISQSDAIFMLSNTTNALFLLDPKGHFLRIHTSSPITLSIDHKKSIMPQTMAITWAEIGSTEGIHVIMFPGGDFYPSDRVIFSTLHVDTSTGSLVWETPNGYPGTGSVFSMSGSNLVWDPDGPFNEATVNMDQGTFVVTAVPAGEGD